MNLNTLRYKAKYYLALIPCTLIIYFTVGSCNISFVVSIDTYIDFVFHKVVLTTKTI